VRTIVALIHQGGFPTADNYSGCSGLSGPILTIAHKMSDEIDVIVSGHTHRPYICTVDGKLVTSAASFGRVVTSIDLTVDKRSAQAVAKTARNIIVTRDVPRDPAQTAIIEHYRPLYIDVASHVVGTLASDLRRSGNVAGESALGNVIADGVLEAARTAGVAAELAFMNPGGIRTDLARGDIPSGVPKSVTYADLSSVLPFRNRIVVRTMTGAMIKDVLEQQFDNLARGEDKILQVSRGFTYTYDRAASKGQRVDPRSMMLDGRPVSLKQRYTVAINEFIADGGDNFTAFTRAADAGTIGMDLDALMEYFKKYSPVDAGPRNRITRVN
jgi:5'-nucleotidase